MRIFLLHAKEGLHRVIHFCTPYPPVPLYRIVYSFSMLWLRITSFSADLISSLCLLSKIKFKLKRKCSLSIYLFLFHFFLFKYLLTVFCELLIPEKQSVSSAPEKMLSYPETEWTLFLKKLPDILPLALKRVIFRTQWSFLAKIVNH